MRFAYALVKIFSDVSDFKIARQGKCVSPTRSMTEYRPFIMASFVGVFWLLWYMIDFCRFESAELHGPCKVPEP